MTTRTYQTRLRLDSEQSALLEAYVALMSKVKHTLFYELQNGQTINELKRAFLPRFGITARQFNSCRVEVEGNIRSLKELNKQRLQLIREKIHSCKKRLKAQCKRNDPRSHPIKKRLDRLTSKKERLANDLKIGRARLCFGSRKLFHAQFHLQESGYEDHADWKRAWTQKRNRSFFLVGSKDETAGNQSCAATLTSDESLTLRLRLPNQLGKYLTLEGIRFAYGHRQIVHALRECQARLELAREGDSSYRTRGQAICYRFCRDAKGWILATTVELSEPNWISDERCGRIGVDLNQDHLAIAETDRHGNLIAHSSVSLDLYGKSQAQSKAIIGDACKQVIDYAIAKAKPLVVELLDFQKKRSQKDYSPKRARQLSSFAYQRILQNLHSRAYTFGIRVHAVNPAYTSVIGGIKFTKQYGLSIHHAAALCIARRIPGFSETLPSHAFIPDGRGSYFAFAVPERNQLRSESHLRQVTKELRAAYAKQFRVTQCQSTGPPRVAV